MARIAITSTGNELNSDMDQRFGRAAYFIIIDPETMEFEAIDNQKNLDLSQGAGIQAGKIIVDKKVNVLITGNCGPKAFKILENSGVKVALNINGKVIDAVSKYKNNELKFSNLPNVEGHHI
ncbi:MAG: NifB/NifX family molybdenum-iron cluster-binding protein [Desulfobacterales bacterium]|nr:NifB/NifX family molybdenum-iron cluster-binding protein [Desulfobacterales bacterium]